MTEHPIIMQGESVRAIIAGRKTMTRRVIRPQPPDWFVRGREPFEVAPGRWGFAAPGPVRACHSEDTLRCPYGAAGDRLWVRERWAAQHEADHLRPREMVPQEIRIHYAATEDRGGLLWRSPLYMPRWASRLALEVVGVRVERVQDISAEDCIAEGLSTTLREHDAVCDLRAAFADLWDRVNGKRPGCAWADSAWVWVVTFRRLDAKEGAAK